jgi:hypothetical protein
MSLMMAKETGGANVTLRGVDAALREALAAEARRRGLSINRTLLALLREAVGLDDRRGAGAKRRFGDLDHLAGTWDAATAKGVLKETEKQRRIDAELWR